MSQLRDLIEQGPKICGAKNHERWSRLFTLAFDHEIAKKDSVFSAKDDETIEDRLETLAALFMADGVEEMKVGYWIDLITLAAYSYAVAKGKHEYRDRLFELKKEVEAEQDEQPELTSVMSVEAASTLSFWI